MDRPAFLDDFYRVVAYDSQDILGVAEPRLAKGRHSVSASRLTCDRFRTFWEPNLPTCLFVILLTRQEVRSSTDSFAVNHLVPPLGYANVPTCQSSEVMCHGAPLAFQTFKEIRSP